MMKKLFYSAFALSLICSSVSAQVEEIYDADELLNMGLEEKEKPQPFTPPEIPGEKNTVTQVTEDEVEKDMPPFKGQDHSLIPWKGIDPEEWLDIHRWIDERQVKDKHEDWKIRLRDGRKLELVGKLLSCHGECLAFRGTSGVRAQHLSQLLEGDEIQTGKDAVAWIFLMDGTLMRVGPESSVSLQEINWSKQEVFYLIRLNRGHAYWHPRSPKEYAFEDGPETDAVSLPVMIKEANQEFFERKKYAETKDQDRLIDYIEPSGVLDQIKTLNEKKTTNNATKSPVARVMMVAPNATIVSSLNSFDFVCVNGGKSFFKKKNTLEGEEFSLLLRGYSDKLSVSGLEEAWYEVDPTGRSHGLHSDALGTLQLLELLTKRIKTLELAREVWIGLYSNPLFESLDDPKNLATAHGYHFWGEELKRRQDFLVEYTRRIETTNLRAIENLLTKLEARGEKVSRELTSVHHQGALNHYLKSLKTRYTAKKLQLREMNDLQYSVWVLKNGRL